MEINKKINPPFKQKRSQVFSFIHVWLYTKWILYLETNMQIFQEKLFTHQSWKKFAHLKNYEQMYNGKIKDF